MYASACAHLRARAFVCVRVRIRVCVRVRVLACACMIKTGARTCASSSPSFDG